MEKRKSIAVFALSITFCAWLFSPLPIWAADEETKKETLIVFAAASMTESMNRIAELYGNSAPDVRLVFNFDSSGTLETQIRQGAECDIFISAGQRQMDRIDIDAAVNTDGADFLLPGTRFDIVANRVVLIVPRGRNDKGISDFRDVVTDKVSLVTLGNADVPAGQYAQEIYTSLGLWERLLAMSKTSFAGNVKEALSQVAAGAADCGVVYSTDAAANSAVEVVAEAPAGTHRPVVYPAAILKATKNEAAARTFVEFLKNGICDAVFREFGFSVPERR